MNNLSTKQLWESVRGLSQPSKMPCYGYSISAKNCITGGKLKSVKGSTCNKCYALRGNYNWPHMQKVLNERQVLMETDPNWVSNISTLINRKGVPWFRWFDSGDLQSVQMLKNIVEVCNLTPTITHWLPTREYSIVSQFVTNGGVIPSNLIVRLSTLMVDFNPPTALANRLGVYTSGVSTTDQYNCVASKQDNECRDCRACWDKNVPNIVYKKH